MGVKHRSAATRSWSRDPTAARWTSGALRHEVSTDERDLDHPSRGPAVARPHRWCGHRCARGPPSAAAASDGSAEDLHDLGRDEHAGHGLVLALLSPRRDREGRVPNGPSLVSRSNINSRPMWPFPSLEGCSASNWSWRAPRVSMRAAGARSRDPHRRPEVPRRACAGARPAGASDRRCGRRCSHPCCPARMAERGARTSARPGTKFKERPICLKGSLQMSRRHEVSGRASWPAAGSGSLPGGGAFDGSPHIGDRPEVIGLASARAAQDPQLLELQ